MSAPIRQIALWQAPVFVVNSRLGFSSVAGPGSNRRGLHQFRPSFSRSYGCNLQSSLTRVFPRTLGSSPCLPVSVSVRAQFVSLEAFLGSVVRLASAHPRVCLPVTSRLLQGGFASLAAYRLRRALPFARPSSLLRHSITQTTPCGTGMFASCPSPMLAASA